MYDHNTKNCDPVLPGGAIAACTPGNPGVPLSHPIGQYCLPITPAAKVPGSPTRLTATVLVASFADPTPLHNPCSTHDPYDTTSLSLTLTAPAPPTSPAPPTAPAPLPASVPAA
jgi:hypothetical protein